MVIRVVKRPLSRPGVLNSSRASERTPSNAPEATRPGASAGGLDATRAATLQALLRLKSRPLSAELTTWNPAHQETCGVTVAAKAESVFASVSEGTSIRTRTKRKLELAVVASVSSAAASVA